MGSQNAKVIREVNREKKDLIRFSRFFKGLSKQATLNTKSQVDIDKESKDKKVKEDKAKKDVKDNKAKDTKELEKTVSDPIANAHAKQALFDDHNPSSKDQIYKQSDITIRQIEDERFGNIDLLDTQSYFHEVIFKKDHEYETFTDFRTAVGYKLQRLYFDANYFVQLLDFDSFQVYENMEECEYPFQINDYYEYIVDDLQHQIELRTRKREHFADHDLFEIIKKTVIANAFLETRNYAHQDIRPSAIMITKFGIPKLMLNVYDIPGKNNKDAYISGLSLYCSPEVYSSMAEPRYSYDEGHYSYQVSRVDELGLRSEHKNPWKSDVFSLGLVILQAGLLKSIQSIYDKQMNCINRNHLANLLSEFCHEYRGMPELCKIVSECLEMREDIRHDFAKLKIEYFPTVTIMDVPADVHMNLSRVNQIAAPTHSQLEANHMYGGNIHQVNESMRPSYSDHGNFGNNQRSTYNQGNMSRMSHHSQNEGMYGSNQNQNQYMHPRPSQTGYGDDKNMMGMPPMGNNHMGNVMNSSVHQGNLHGSEAQQNHPWRMNEPHNENRRSSVGLLGEMPFGEVNQYDREIKATHFGNPNEGIYDSVLYYSDQPRLDKKHDEINQSHYMRPTHVSALGEPQLAYKGSNMRIAQSDVYSRPSHTNQALSGYEHQQAMFKKQHGSSIGQSSPSRHYEQNEAMQGNQQTSRGLNNFGQLNVNNLTNMPKSNQSAHYNQPQQQLGGYGGNSMINNSQHYGVNQSIRDDNVRVSTGSNYNNYNSGVRKSYLG